MRYSVRADYFVEKSSARTVIRRSINSDLRDRGLPILAAVMRGTPEFPVIYDGATTLRSYHNINGMLFLPVTRNYETGRRK